MSHSPNWENKRARHQKMIEVAREGGCVDCGNEDPRVLELHHRDPALRLFNPRSSRTRKTTRQMREELEKCDLICANCHRIRHAGEPLQMEVA